MTGPDLEKVSLSAAITAGTYPPDFKFPACAVDQMVEDGQLLTVGNLRLTVIETPGHARGHVSYLFQEQGRPSLLGGDIVFAWGRISLLNTWDTSIQDYSATMARLHSMGLERLYPGHGVSRLSNAHQDVEIAHQIFAKMGIPRNLL